MAEQVHLVRRIFTFGDGQQLRVVLGAAKERKDAESLLSELQRDMARLGGAALVSPSAQGPKQIGKGQDCWAVLGMTGFEDEIVPVPVRGAIAEVAPSIIIPGR